MTRSPERRIAVRPSKYPLGVFRVDHGQTWQFWMLSPKVGGLMYHWWRGRSEYCVGDECPKPMHTSPRTWHGYVAAMLWDAPSTLWFPTVLEITEALELDLRGVYSRGQVWEISRADKEGKKKQPLVGQLLRSAPPAEVPECFEVRDVVRNMYHVEAIDLTSPNPLPARVIVSPRPGPAPVDQPDPAQAAEREAQQRAAFFARGGFSSANKNGHAEK